MERELLNPLKNPNPLHIKALAFPNIYHKDHLHHSSIT